MITVEYWKGGAKVGTGVVEAAGPEGMAKWCSEKWGPGEYLRTEHPDGTATYTWTAKVGADSSMFPPDDPPPRTEKAPVIGPQPPVIGPDPAPGWTDDAD